MPPTTLSSFSKRLRILKGFIAFVLCASFVLPQILAPRAAKASTGPVAPKSAPPEAFLLHSSSSVNIELISHLTSIANAIGDVINGPTIPEGLEMAKVPSLSERFGSMMASAVTVKAAPPPAAAPPPPPGTVSFDFDGDGKADIARWRSANSEFKIQNSNGGAFSTYTVGSAGSKPAPADYDGDNVTDAAVFSSGTWTIRQSSNGQTTTISNFGQSGDIPVSGDYVGNSEADAAVFRPSNNTWYIRETPSGNVTSTQFGASGDIVVPGNYDGGKMDIAVYRPSTGVWHILGSTSGYYGAAWGVASDIPVPADFDGDSKTDLAVYRGSSGTWYVYNSSGAPFTAQTWGNYGDQPVPADYDNDGKADFAVWRPTNGVWYTIKSSNSTYDYDTLGAPGEMAVPSAYLKQIGGQVFGSSLAKARLKPRNATGGTNLYSQNFSWGTSLVGLPGRAGLDAGFGISYNSLVWTKDGDTINFDTNNDNVSPGFRLGFSTIEPAYYDSVTQKWNYLMVTPSGGRVEFRQTAASDIYETADSSYAQLQTKGAANPNDPVEDITIEVTGTDGTRMSYEWKGGAFRCNQIKDRNGNYITIVHDEQGLLRTVTDTLGRVITVEYDPQLYPTAIKQTWNSGNGDLAAVVHTWASLSYSTQEINTNFAGGIAVSGPPNGTVLKVLERVTYADGSSTRFDHNSYGQVWRIRNHAPDGHELNYTRTNLQTVAGTQSDCPRFVETATNVENFNSGQEVITTNTYQESQQVPGGGPTGTLVTVTNPDGVTPSGVVISKTWFSDYGWSLGLPFYSETCTSTGCEGTDKKKWTWSTWTQDDTNLLYVLNPRMTSTVVSDWISSRKTEIDYYPVTENSSISYFGLTKEVRIIDAYNNNTILKKNEITYNNDPAYLSRRIIGLPAQTLAHGRNDLTQALELVSQVSYSYDQFDFSNSALSQNISPIQHDSSNYGASFVIGRGNLTSTTRHDGLEAVTASVKYNTAGAPVAQIDPMSRMVKIGYADNFNSSGNPITFAYPTTVTDPANNSSTVQYRYDIGANVRAQSPAPAGHAQGKITERFFDALGRLEKEVVVNSGAYSRYEYPTNGIQSKAYSTITDTNGSGADTADEVLSESWSDGAGRVLRSRTEHPGSLGGYSGKLVEYNIVGQIKRETVPTEMDSSWNPAGDDYRGMSGGSYIWLWNSTEYDWKGRVTRIIPSDSTGSDGKDQLFSYNGCGCAGGQVTTVQGETIVESDWQGNNPVTLGRRTQKIYEDILGRNYRTEVYTWNGANNYSTTAHLFNGRDQVINTTQFGDGTYRTVTMSYDGFGRMKTRHYPIENAETNTTWTYNSDDSINTVTDPRGVVTNFNYYSTTGLLHQITYDVPTEQTANIPDTPDVTFGYDNLGNRISMLDGTGSTAYTYNELSQLMSETKTFTGLTGTFPINYTYNLSGGLKTMSDPQNSTRKVVYNQDKIGRIAGADLSVQGTETQYILDTKYRAWGDLKSYKYDWNGVVPSQAFFNFFYDNGLQVSGFETGHNSQSYGLISFQRFADGKLNKVSTEMLYKYDHVGRLIKGYTGSDANPNSPPANKNAFKQDITYNSFSEVTGITGQVWETNLPARITQNDLSTGRLPNTGYDASGNIVSNAVGSSFTRTIKYDAAGRQVETFDPAVRTGQFNNTAYHYYDGNGRKVKQTNVTAPPNQPSFSSTVYEIHSTVLGGEKVGEFIPRPEYSHRIFISPVLGGKLTYRNIENYSEDVQFTSTSPEGLFEYNANLMVGAYDPRGADVGIEEPLEPGFIDGTYGRGNDPSLYNRCAEGGIPVSCSKQERFDKRADEIFKQIWTQWANDKALWRNPHGSGDNKNPHKINNEIHESPHADATTSTDKPAGSPEDEGTVDIATLPCEDSEEVICTRVARGSLRLTPVVDAGEGGNEEWIKVPLPTNFRDLIEQRLQTGDCNTFIKDVLSKIARDLNGEIKAVKDKYNAPFTPYEPAAKDGLDALSKISNFTLVDNLNLQGHGAGGTIKGSIRGGDAEVQIASKGYYSPPYRGTNPVAMWTNWYIGSAIHEIAHLAGGGFASDGRLAKAVYDMGLSTTEVKNPDTTDVNEIYKYSDAWQTALANHCGAR